MIRRHLAFWKQEVDNNPIVLGWLIVLTIVAGMNAVMGYETGGGGLEGVFLAMGFASFAGLGAYAMTEQARAIGARRAGLVTLVVLQLAIGQMAGWQTLGLSLSRGSGQLAAQATERQTLDERISGLREERRGIGVTRAIGAIEADLDLELRKTSRTYPKGDGPKATALRGELATAKRAGEIEGELPKLVTRQGHGSQVTDGNAHYGVPQAIATRVMGWFREGDERVEIGPGDVRFFWLVLLVAALEFVATLGGWLFGVRGHGLGASDCPPGSRPDARWREQLDDEWAHDWGPKRIAGAPDAPERSGTAREAPSTQWEREAKASVVGVQPAAPHSSLHGAPIHINVGVPGSLIEAPLDGASGRLRAAKSDAPTRERHDLPALPARVPPADRSTVQRHLTSAERPPADVMLAFRAACVVDAPGALVTVEDVFRRYVRWAGARAVDRAAFAEMFPDVTGLKIVELGGVDHVAAVSLRAAPALERTH